MEGNIVQWTGRATPSQGSVRGIARINRDKEE
jgi:hypothetical protein